MLNLGSTYLIVRDMDKSIDFYEALLEMKVTAKNEDRWAQFNFGNACIALWNPKYDEEKIREGKDLSSAYNPAYLEYKANNSITYGNNVVLNFWVEDLNQEYERIRDDLPPENRGLVKSRIVKNSIFVWWLSSLRSNVLVPYAW